MLGECVVRETSLQESEVMLGECVVGECVIGECVVRECVIGECVIREPYLWDADALPDLLLLPAVHFLILATCVQGFVVTAFNTWSKKNVSIYSSRV